MQSVNFEFLRPQWPDLAELGGFAEQYCWTDPSSAAVKLRAFCEQIVVFVYQHHGLPKPFQANLNDLIESAPFQNAVPSVVVGKLHALRITGNSAAHGGKTSEHQAKYLVREAFDLGCWMAMVFAAKPKAGLPEYKESAPPDSKAKLKAEKKAVLEKLAVAEAQMQQLLEQLEVARSKAEKAEVTAVELQAALNTGQQAANALAFSEATTRKAIIDTLLIEAGWDVGENGQNTATVTQEHEILHQPTDTGKGYADYVLWDAESGKPLAVIEAKRTSKDAIEGQTQARMYADGLEKMTGHRPMIFFTNGFETWIWNDKADEIPRRVFGFYAKESLEQRLWQRANRLPAADLAPSPDIAGRMYQLQAIRQVIERFAAKHLGALIVQATGTGKTRVAISLADTLIRGRWAKRVLFLCDRRELRKQAHNAFKQFLPGEPRAFVTSATWQDRQHHIYLATYPAMMKCFQSFDVGFFDLVIFDESHRSIYNRYRDLVKYFDCMKLGLTATPVEFISRNTYDLFRCEDGDPTALFTYEEAISYSPRCLVPYTVETHTTPFLELGIKYAQLDAEQKRQLEEQDLDAQNYAFEPGEVDKAVFNKDTNRHVLRNLMDNGTKVKDGSQLGKSIIFARNHHHAVLLKNVFDEMYPQYGGKFCQVIDNYDPRAEALIDEFKDSANPLTIAVSVDMLDTGIDVPEVVNLVFAKPVYSKVKFVQMIGRGTRLCPNLFGPGKHKDGFVIFDHWKVFQFFDEKYRPVEPANSKSLLQLVFEARIQLADLAQTKFDQEVYAIARANVAKDIADLPTRSVSIQEKWKQVATAREKGFLDSLDAARKGTLLQDIAPLMQWRTIEGSTLPHQFDWLLTRMQVELLRKSATFDDLKAELVNWVSELPPSLNPVKQKGEYIAKVQSSGFWEGVTIPALEEIRNELRGIAHFRSGIGGGSPLLPKIVDIKEDASLIQHKLYTPKDKGLSFAQYHARVTKVLADLFDLNPTLQKIKAGEPVDDADLKSLVSLVLTQHPDLDLTELLSYYPETAGHLDVALRSIIGLDAQAVAEKFEAFAQTHKLNSRQIRFLDLLKNHISRYGSIELSRLYEDPFASVESSGPDGLFTSEQDLDELFGIIATFGPKQKKSL